MASSQARSPECLPRVENVTTQERRPSVTWNVSSPKANTAATKTTTSSDTFPASAVRRQKLSSRPEISLGTQPQVCFLRPRITQPLVLFSVMNSSEAAVTKLLPKSHLTRVIIRDNLSAQRLYEMEMKASEKNKRKMNHLYEHLKKKFMMDQIRKLGRWKREYMNMRQYLESTHARKVTPSLQASHPGQGRWSAPGS